MQDRLDDLPGKACHKARTLNSLGYEIVRRARPGVRMLDEREIRERMEPHLKLTFRANTDALRPYLEALEEVQLGLRSPKLVEAQRGDVEGFAGMYEHYREALEPTTRSTSTGRSRPRSSRCAKTRRFGARCNASAGISSSTSSRTCGRRTCSSCV